MLRGKVDLPLRVVEHAAVQNDAAFVGSHDPGNALAGQAFPAPRRSQKGENTVIGGKFHMKLKTIERLSNVDFQRHFFAPTIDKTVGTVPGVL